MKTFIGTLALLVAALPSAVSAQQQQQRTPIVTVRQMQDLAKTGQAQAFSQMIQTAVSSTGKFRVIESNFADLRDQQELGNNGTVTTRTPGKRGGIEGADFLIYGTITGGASARQGDSGAQVGRATLNKFLGGVLGNGNCAKSTASLAVDIKIVDGATGEIRYTNSINQRSVSKTNCSGDPQLDLAALFRSAADQIATGLVTTIYPIKIAAVQANGTVMLNYGTGTVVPGTLLNVYRKGAAVIDPDTGKVLSDEGEQVAQLQVTEVTARFSKAVTVGTPVEPVKIGQIVRLAPPPVAPTKKDKRK